MSPFERFWAAWPRSERKVSKSLCQKKWAKLGLDLQAEEIIRHVEYMKTKHYLTLSDAEILLEQA